MRAAIIALAVSLAGGASDAQPQQPPPASPLTPEQQQAIAKMPSASEDKRVKADDIDTLMAEGKIVFLDVREPKELEELGTYEGYINIPVTELERRLNELPKDKAILTA